MLVERDALTAQLRAELAAASGGAGRVVAVYGEAGAGKTALVNATAPAEALWGFCEPLAPPRPLTPWRDVARALWPRRRSADVGEALLEELQQQPHVVVIEDAHWIDEASSQVLRFLVRRIHTTQSLLVVTYRDELDADHPLRGALAARDVVRLPVPPLSRSAVETLVADRGLAVDEAYRLTGGNAFLVSQLATNGTTDPLHDAVGARLAGLRAAVRVLVELLAVVPGRIDNALVDWDLLDDAVRVGLLDVTGAQVRFRHELVRLAVVAGLLPGVRVDRHAEVLRRLRSSPDPEPAALAFHARHARESQLAFEYECAAAELALASASHREAADHYRRAVSDLPRDIAAAAAARLWLACAREEFATGRDETARAAADRALERCPPDDVDLRAEALLLRGRVAASEAEARERTQAAVALLEPLGTGVGLARAYARLANMQMIARELPAAVGTARRALAVSDDAEAQVAALQALGAAMTLLGDDPGCTHLRRAVELARIAGLDAELSRAYANLVSAAGEQRLYEVSARAAEEALAFFVARDVDSWAQYTRAWHARCLFERGEWSRASGAVDAVLAGAETSTIAVITAMCVRGRIRARRGDPRPDEPLATAKGRADGIGSLQRIAAVEAGRAELRWLSGLGPDDDLPAAYDLACLRANPWAVGELGYWMWRHGLLTALPDIAAQPYRLHVGGDPAGAAQAWQLIGCPYEEADALCDAGDEASLRVALELFTRLGAVPGRSRAARRLRELGVRSVPRGPRSTTAAGPDGLTSREQEILRWVRNGHTDAEIAAALHLSVKTVGHHVSAVLGKTGSRTRRELQRRPR